MKKIIWLVVLLSVCGKIVSAADNIVPRIEKETSNYLVENTMTETKKLDVGVFVYNCDGAEYIGGYPFYHTMPYSEQEKRHFQHHDYIIAGDYYMARRCAYDWFVDRRNHGMYNTLQFYDKDFNLIKEENFDGYVYVEEMGYYDGKYYCMYEEECEIVENADGTQTYVPMKTLEKRRYGQKTIIKKNYVVSEDMENWEEAEEVPKRNANCTIFKNAVAFHHGMKRDVQYECETLTDEYCNMFGEWFLKKDKDYNLYLTNDNVYFVKIEMPDEFTDHDREYQDIQLIYEYQDEIIVSFTNEIYLRIPKGPVYQQLYEMKNAPYVQHNNTLLGFETPPVMEDDRTLVPMRFLFEQLGAEVDWNQETMTATATLGTQAVAFSIDDTGATVNSAPVTMDVPARLVNDKTMVPLRFLSENLGYTVTWDGENRIAAIENR